MSGQDALIQHHHGERTMSRLKMMTGMMLALSVAACASSGVKVGQDKMSTLQKGRTTYAEVMQGFGRPSGSTLNSDGTRTISYNYFGYQTRPENFIPIVGSFLGGADMEHTNVTMSFDRNGVLRDFTSTEGGSGTSSGLGGLSQQRRDVREVK